MIRRRWGRLVANVLDGVDRDVLRESEDLHFEQLDKESDDVLTRHATSDDDRLALAVKANVAVGPGNRIAARDRPCESVLVHPANRTAPDPNLRGQDAPVISAAAPAQPSQWVTTASR